MCLNFRTDLAEEQLEQGAKEVSGTCFHRYSEKGYAVTEVEILTDEAASFLQKRKGRYLTLKLPSFEHWSDDFEGEAAAVASLLKRFLPGEGTVLIAGLGNETITPDALGPRTASGVLATRHVVSGEDPVFEGLALRSAAVLAPGVLGQTGIETAELVESVCRSVQPSAVIAVDALAAGSVHRLGTTVQLTDAGINPGSGVRNRRSALNEETLGIPVIAVGVPTVADLLSLRIRNGEQEEGLTDCIVTPRGIDLIIERASSLLALAVNMALHPNLTAEEIRGLTG